MMKKGMRYVLPAILVCSALVLSSCTDGSPTSPFDGKANGQNAPAPSSKFATKDVTTKDDLSLSPSPITGVDNYNWMVGAGVLCVVNENACPVVSEAENGQRITITGGGALSLTSGEFTGGGTFNYTDAQGNLLGRASWDVIQLLNFHSYGEINEEGMPNGSSGGRLMARVHIAFDNGIERNGVLWVTCARGEQVPPGQRDGVELNVPGVGLFNEPISGGTAFVFND